MSPTQTALVPALPGEAEIDDALIDQAVGDLNRIYTTKGLETARAVGEYLLVTFFGGDPARFHAQGKGHASFRRLADRDDLSVSYSFLWHACGVVEQLRQLPPDLGSALPLSHHRLLLSVKDPAEKERLARAAVARGLSKRALEAAVQDARPVVAPEHRPGRRPLPAVVKGLTRLRAAVALAASEEVSAAKLSPEQARAVLQQLDVQVAALGQLRTEVARVVGKG